MKKKIIHIIICLLIVVSLSLGIGLIIRQNKQNDEDNKKEPKFPYVLTLKDSPGFEISSIPYNGDNELALFMTSFEEHVAVDVELTFLDAGKQIISTDTSSIAYLASQKQYLISIPVDSKNVKFIEIKIRPKKDDNGEELSASDIILDSRKLNFDIKDSIDENNNTTITLSTINPYNQDIHLINGYVLLYQSDKLVDAIPYSGIDFNQEEEISIKVNSTLHDTTGVFKYNKIKVIVNELF